MLDHDGRREPLRHKEDNVGDTKDPELRWLEQGAGEPVLFLHGLMGQMHHWAAVMDGLAFRCRPMALALPIFDPALREVSIEGLSRHVLRFLDALDISRAVIGGNSLGGHVALTVAVGHPDRVSGLVLTGSSGLFERSFTRGVPHQPTREYVRQKMEEVFFDPSLVTDAWVESVRAVLTTASSALRVLRFAREARRHNVAERLGAIEAPTLLVWGREDRITPPDVAERFRALIPGARLSYLARCGHAAMLEQPAAFTEAVADWLEASRDRRARGVALLGGVR
jgi:pimeloyl-ACP methyl ester carboxylesterase